MAQSDFSVRPALVVGLVPGSGHHPAGALWKSPDRKYRRRSGNVDAFVGYQIE